MIVYMVGRKTSHPELVICAKYHLNLHAFFFRVGLVLSCFAFIKVFLVFQLKKKKSFLEKCKGKCICGLAK